jgi:hypothetical protein
MVVGPAGETLGSDGTSHSLSNPEDRYELLALRALADLIVTDAQTAERENYRQSKVAPIQVWSRHPDSIRWTPIQVEGGLSLTLVDSSDLNSAVAGLTGSNVLLETGPTLSALLLPWISSLAITVTSHDNAARTEALNALLRKLGAEPSQWQTTWNSGEVNSYALVSRRGSL